MPFKASRISKGFNTVVRIIEVTLRALPPPVPDHALVDLCIPPLLTQKRALRDINEELSSVFQHGCAEGRQDYPRS